ncbi:MAG: hypothetical protein JWL58_4511 [Streptosporangiaceae bacterium]|nr:hypothetical protein [Streptosporangiaceae bacterium]
MILPIVSIVMPAHNEEAAIGDNLRRLLAGTEPGEFDVIVVANACSDRTAELARQDGVRVLETQTPGKVNALRLGDEACRTFPRVYVDADVEVTAGSVRALVEAAAGPGVLACAPVPEWNLAGAGWVARRLHRVHEPLIAPFRALSGVGVYVLTEKGHERIFPMPDVISDDGLVHRSFAAEERAVVAGARSVVRPARTVSAHLKRRVRVRQGNRQLDALGLPLPEGRLELRSLGRLLAERRVSPLDAGCYLAVLLLDRALTRVRRDQVSWGTDASSRGA